MTKTRAFTLMEVVVASGIVLVGFIAVAQINPSGSQGLVVSRDRLQAERIARNVIDRARSMPFGADLSSLQGPVNLTGDLIEGKPVGQEFNVTKVSSEIPTVSSPTLAGFGNVTVTVVWRQGVGTTDGSGNVTLTMTGGLSREP